MKRYRTFLFALLFSLACLGLRLIPYCLAGPDLQDGDVASPDSGNEAGGSSGIPDDYSRFLFAGTLGVYFKLLSAYWDTFGLLAFQKIVAFLLLLALLPERRMNWSINPPQMEGDISGLLAPSYAGFASRAAAAVIDFLLLTLPFAITGFAIFFATALVIDSFQVNLILVSVNYLMILGPACLAAVCESSKVQASPGKLLFHIRVTDINGARVSFVRALERNLAFGFSDFVLGLGFISCIWTRKRQCFHDYLTNCLVLKSK